MVAAVVVTFSLPLTHMDVLIPDSPGLEAQTSACRSRFMETAGGSFCFQGEPVILYGATFYPFWTHEGENYRSSGWLQEDFALYIDTIIGLATGARLNALRPTDYLANAAEWDDPTIWANMDYLVNRAEEMGLWVILDISTFRAWLENQGVGFVYDPQDWMPFVRFVAERYRDSTVIAYYSIAPEIPAHDNGGATSGEYVEFFSELLQEIHTHDQGHHLISVGGLSYLDFDSGIPWQDLFRLPYDAVAAIHVYSEGDRAISVPEVSAWALANDKPFFIEEFGFQQGLGDEERAAAYQDMYELAKVNHASGLLFWNLGLEVTPESHDVSPLTPWVWEVIQQNSPLRQFQQSPLSRNRNEREQPK